MKIDLTELLQKVGNEADLAEEITVSWPEDSLTLTKPIRLDLHLVNTGSSVLLTGRAETEAELECSRCLKKYRVPLAADLEEEFTLDPVRQGAGETELHAEDFASPIDPDNSIDLAEIIRQDLLLALPIKTLCQQNCQGIKGEE
ncbi:MAG: DUF177 domain-containing protein [Candidatus Saganbacteria bacterium]|nr:DUF177 domain-containing protein [Candidatus Saganbacteria bacterium]